MKMANYREYSWEEHFCDGEGEHYDEGESDTSDSEFLDYDDDITCMKCKLVSKEGQEIEDIKDKKGFAIFRADHIDKRGAWHKDPLKNPNKEILMKAMAEEI